MLEFLEGCGDNKKRDLSVEKNKAVSPSNIVFVKRENVVGEVLSLTDLSKKNND
jgi:hypothetical protein